MKYYLLADRMEHGRWHLNRLMDGSEHVWVTRATPVGTTEGVAARRMSMAVDVEGTPLRYCRSSFAAPVAAEDLGCAIAAVSPEDVQLVPVDIPGYPGYVVINVLRSIDCLDEVRSSFTRWLPKDNRPDMLGGYRVIERMVLDPSRIPADAHVFRLGGAAIFLVVSQHLRAVMEQIGCEGALFTEIQLGDGEDE